MRQTLSLKALPVLLVAMSLAVPAPAEEDEHHDHHHHISVVGGGAFKAEKPKSAGFLGAEYEYKFNQKVGLAAYYEETFGDFNLQAIGGLFVWHPIPPLKLAAGAAVERKLVAKDSSHGKPHDKALIRFQVAYDFHAGNVTYGPLFAWDLIEDQSNVVYLGFGVGYGF